jgi:hypothetical protein|tara:strand:+ start:8407 stop:8832 length:426 start_codon:yes stop_codon:yes gene_type:complete
MIKKLKFVLIFFCLSFLFFLVLGITTDIIPTIFYKRMIQTSILDYVFLISTSIMLGGYLTLNVYGKSKLGKKEDVVALGGGITGLFAFGCPMCNAILITIVGTGSIMFYYEYIRPLVGILSVCIIAFCMYFLLRNKRYTIF